MNRREFIAASLAVAASPAALSRALSTRNPAQPLYQISLAQWSYHRAVQSGAMTIFDFPRIALHEHAIDAVEYVSTLFPRKDLAGEAAGLRKRCEDLGVRSLLIMVDAEGALGDPDNTARVNAVDNHMKWLDAAKSLGCHSIRVNAQSSGKLDEQERLAAEGLRALCEHADPLGIDVIVENHWGLSSYSPWLLRVMDRVDHPRIGTLPDFGNFDPNVQDRYAAVRDMMPYARAVSAKSNDFDAQGDETTTDYLRMMRIVSDSGYRGHVGIEYEGGRLPEPEGINATKSLLERVRTQLESENTEP